MAAADLRPYLGQSIVLQLRVTDKGGLSDTKGFTIQITERSSCTFTCSSLPADGGSRPAPSAEVGV